MNTSLVLLISCILILLLFFPLFFFLRRSRDISLENDILVLKSPFDTKKIDLDKELRNWKVQKAYYLRWGVFYSISMLLKNGKRINISSMYYQTNYDILYQHLNSSFQNRRIKD